MQDWKIEIIKQKDGTIQFVPNQPNAKPGSPLLAQLDDNVHWFNSTGETLEIVLNNGTDTVKLPGVPPNQPSQAYDVAQPSNGATSWTVTYFCPQYPNQKGTMLATATPIAVEIVASGGTTSFSPNPTVVLLNDLVSWLNSTNQQHQIVASNGTDSFTSDPITVGLSSSPLYNVTQPAGNPPPQSWTVNYSCKLHPSEKGTLSAFMPTGD